MKTVPEKYQVKGLKASGHSKAGECEALYYETPNGARFALAKDFMGIQLCMGGRFWPPPFTPFPSMEVAVLYLKGKTKSAIDFFDNVKVELEKEKEILKCQHK